MNPHEDLEAYVLGALDSDDAFAFERHLSTCASCREGIASYSAVMRGLRSIPLVAPPSIPVPQRARANGLLALAAVALLGVGLGVGASLVHPDRDEAAIVAMIADRPHEVALRGTIARGQVIVGAERLRTAFIVRGLPRAANGHVYQVWVKSERSVSPGLLHRTRDGLEVLVVDGDLVEGAHHIGVTLEPAGGSPQRTGPTQVQGDIN